MPAQDWRAITQLRLVKGLFMRVDAEQPALIRDAEIERIRAMEDKSGHVSGRAANQFIRDQRVYATTGVFVGGQGRYQGQGRGGCDVALLELFGRETRIEFAPGVLRAA